GFTCRQEVSLERMNPTVRGSMRACDARAFANLLMYSASNTCFNTITSSSTSSAFIHSLLMPSSLAFAAALASSLALAAAICAAVRGRLGNNPAAARRLSFPWALKVATVLLIWLSRNFSLCSASRMYKDAVVCGICGRFCCRQIEKAPWPTASLARINASPALIAYSRAWPCELRWHFSASSWADLISGTRDRALMRSVMTRPHWCWKQHGPQSRLQDRLHGSERCDRLSHTLDHHRGAEVAPACVH